MLKYAYYMPLYVIKMQLYAQYMHKICKYVDCISQICKGYARNRPEICLNMQVICRYMLKICKYC